jgi:alkaline phosphatase D
VWDDHDYGINNGDKTFKMKGEMRDLYLDFIGESKDSERRLERDRGIYQDYLIKTPDGIKVHFIMLDVRFDYNSSSKDRIGEY